MMEGNVHRNRRRRVGRWTMVAVGALLAVALAPHGAGAAPPDSTYEITTPGTDLSALDQGDVIVYEGTCWSSGLGALDEAFVRVARVVLPGSGLTPFSFRVSVPIDQGDGTFVGTLAVPDDAPDGNYSLGLSCIQEDQVLQGPELPVVIGDPVPPSTSTTTTSTTSTTASTPDPADPIPVPPAPPAAPADPIAAAAALTG
jgi:hypothetical protein